MGAPLRGAVTEEVEENGGSQIYCSPELSGVMVAPERSPITLTLGRGWSGS